jgi:hypothetical protein
VRHAAQKVFACETFGVQPIDFIDSGFCENLRNRVILAGHGCLNAPGKVFACETFATQALDFIGCACCENHAFGAFRQNSPQEQSLTASTKGAAHGQA